MSPSINIPQIVYSEPQDNTYKSPVKTAMEGEILIHFPGWTETQSRYDPFSSEDIDLGDYPMAILTQGASRTDPITTVSDNVQVFYPPSPRRSIGHITTPAPDPTENWRLSVELDYSSASEGDSSGSLSPTSSASFTFPSPKAAPCEIVALPEDKPLRRRGHVRRPSSENQPANRNARSTPTPPPVSPPKRLSSLISQSSACDPVLPVSPPKPSKNTSTSCAPPKTATVARSASICPDRVSWITSPDSMPIDWSFLELTLGCASNDPFGSQPPTPPAKAKTVPVPTPKQSLPMRSSSLKRRQLTPALEVLKEEAEDDCGAKPPQTTSSCVKSSRRKAALVGARSFVPNLTFSP